jgi:hypothetical protein
MRCFLDKNEAFQGGIHCNVVSYSVVPATPRLIHARIGPVRIILIRAKNCLLVGQFQAAQALRI